jgi:hypothetical protein
MFRSTRHTLRASRGLRSTLKKQRGGAALQPLCAWRTTDPKTTKWATVLVDSPFTFLLDGGWITQPTANEQYTTIVERQDELFMLAMDAIYAEIGADKEDEGDILAKYVTFDKNKEDTLKNYINDIIYLVNLKELKTTAQSGRQSTTKTKFEEVLAEPMLHLLLNPLRIQNQFIANLATFIVNLNPAQLDSIKDNKDLTLLLAIRYDSIAKANVLASTSTDIRDGPYITSTTVDIKSMLGTDKLDNTKLFWNKFLSYCQGKNDETFESLSSDIVTYTEGFGSQKDRINTAMYAAYIYGLYSSAKKTMVERVNTFFNGIDITENKQLRFLHHLIYTIESLTPSEAQTSSQGM